MDVFLNTCNRKLNLSAFSHLILRTGSNTQESIYNRKLTVQNKEQINTNCYNYTKR